MAGYTAIYNPGDIGTVILDWLIGIFAGLTDQSYELGVALAITIVIGAYLLLSGKLFGYIRLLRNQGK